MVIGVSYHKRAWNGHDSLDLELEDSNRYIKMSRTERGPNPGSDNYLELMDREIFISERDNDDDYNFRKGFR